MGKSNNDAGRCQRGFLGSLQAVEIAALAPVLGMAALCATLAGCAGEAEGTAYEVEQQLPDVAELGQEFREARCATTPADATFSPYGMRQVSAPYSNPSCVDAYVVDVFGYTGGETTVRIAVGNPPICSFTSLKTDLFRLDGGMWNKIRSEDVAWPRFGVPCFTPINLGAYMASGYDYRIVASASRNVYPQLTQLPLVIESKLSPLPSP